MGIQFSPDTFGDIQFLSQSPVRLRFLSELSANGPMSRCELRDVADVSRTTVSRNLDALADRGWVEAVNGEYRASPSGELLASAVAEFFESASNIERLEPFFRWFPVDALDVEWEWFLDADVYPSTSSDPYAPLDRHTERVQSATRFRGLLPQVGLRPMQALGSELEAFDHELVVSESVAETLRTEEKYVDARSAVNERGQFAVYVSQDPVSAYVGLFDEDVQIGVSDEDGVPRALLETADERVRRWAEETYESHRAEAEPLD